MSSTCFLAQGRRWLMGRLWIIILSDLELMSWKTKKLKNMNVKSCLFQSTQGVDLFWGKTMLFFSHSISLNVYQVWKSVCFHSINLVIWFHLPFKSFCGLVFLTKLILFNGRFTCIAQRRKVRVLECNRAMKMLWNDFLEVAAVLWIPFYNIVWAALAGQTFVSHWIKH